MSLERTPVPLPVLPLCPRCGVIAPAQLSGCPVCDEAFVQPRTTVRLLPTHVWVAVRCSFQCRSCQFLSPLDELDIDGSVECAQCGQSQRFDVEAWHEALAFAHGVGDLGFPLPEGRFSHPHVWIGDDNPYLALGTVAVFAEHRQSSVAQIDGVTVHRSLFIEAAPGHPSCEACHTPLAVEIERQEVRSSCATCGVTGSYRLPSGATKYSAALLGVVAEAQRSDRQRARMQATASGPISLACPQCGGALPATREHILTCDYCGMAALIPAQARLRDVGQVLTPDIWWLAFGGPSPLRIALEQPEPPVPTKADKERLELTDLELADEKPGRYDPQVWLNLALPGAALLFAILAYWLIG